MTVSVPRGNTVQLHRDAESAAVASAEAQRQSGVNLARAYGRRLRLVSDVRRVRPA